MPAAGSAYDAIAEMYHSLWGDWYLPAALPALEKLFFSRLQEGVRVLDVCCGSGHVTSEIVRRGFRVTAIDNSAGLIAIAQEQMPGVDFRVGDARNFRLEERYQGAVSTFDSLNHILTIEELRQAFIHVRQVLEESGLFVFDMNLEEAYGLDMHEWVVNQVENGVGLTRGFYDKLSHTAKTELIWFKQAADKGCWHRYDGNVEQRCYTQNEIVNALRDAGFQNIERTPAMEIGVKPGMAYGRIFFSARA